MVFAFLLGKLIFVFLFCRKYDDEDDAKDDYAKRVAKTPSSSANVFFSPAKATRQTFLSKNRLHASFLCKA